jgi:Leucine-rich repeat (LRR) protein
MKLSFLDLSCNHLKEFLTLPASSEYPLFYLNLSYNNLESFLGKEMKFDGFVNDFADLKTIDFSKSFAKTISNKEFSFNLFLEVAYFSENEMKSFPKFCQISKQTDICCRLRELKFNSNNLKKIFFSDLLEMTNLEYLNLENNSISLIEFHSFSDLIKLETLILSLNRLTYFNDTFIFSPLSSLKFLNLSSNRIEIIQSNLFDSLFKLETLDLSLNRIRFIQSFALNSLLNLRNLHLNENDESLLIESNSSFSHLDSIQNVYLSKSILFNSDTNVKVFLNLFAQKQKQVNKSVLGISFYKSLFLISDYSSQYDCNLTLFFIRRNIHFNFRTESNIFDYFDQCSLLVIKNSSSSIMDENPKSNRNILVFTDFRPYFFWIYLLLVICIGVYILKISILGKEKFF